MTNDELTHLSKRMSYALRHSPKSFRLQLAEDGSVDVNVFVNAISDRGHRYTLDDINAVLAMPGKKRFALEDGRIRAYYGHSVPQPIEHERITPPAVLYHATTHRALDAILREGLKPMNRQHVHLASTKETALVAGRRRDANPPLLAIDAKRANDDGIAFFRGNEDIYLADPIPARYITVLSR